MIEHPELWGAVVAVAIMVFELRYRLKRRMDTLEKKIDEILDVVIITKKAQIVQ